MAFITTEIYRCLDSFKLSFCVQLRAICGELGAWETSSNTLLVFACLRILSSLVLFEASIHCAYQDIHSSVES